MDISLIICTYNRCESLPAALENVAHSVLPNSITWEILVVDNNSSDRTHEVVEDFIRRYPGRFRYLLESRQGKSYALNSAIWEAHGEILAFTDDDVIVEPDWLQNLTANLHGNEWAGAAGRVLRTWTCSPPRWLSLERRYEKMGWALVSFDLKQEACELPFAYPPVGANMAFRKEVFSRHGVFRTDLGPAGNVTGSRFLRRRARFPVWEDTELGQRMMGNGERLRYEPSAVVYHPVPERRLTRDYFLGWWFGRGLDSIRIMPKGRPVLGIPRPYVRLVKMTILLFGNGLAWLTAIKSYRRFYYKLLTWELAGAIMGSITYHPRHVHGDFTEQDSFKV